MAVLLEGISVVLRTQAINEKYVGGWSAFAADVPNATLCSDGELVRVGFMHPTEVEAYCTVLEGKGLTYTSGGEAADFVLADQVHGFSLPCPWAQFGHAEVDGGTVAAARLASSSRTQIVAPPGWQYANSLSSRVDVLSPGGLSAKYRYLRQENGQEVYLNLATGKEMYLSRSEAEALSADAEETNPGRGSQKTH